MGMAAILPGQHDTPVFCVYDNPNVFNPNIQIFKDFKREQKCYNLNLKPAGLSGSSWLMLSKGSATAQTLQVSLTFSQLMSAYKSH